MHRLGVVVPFRNRWEHLDSFYREIIPYLSNSNIDFRIIIVEQDNDKAFNRGTLCNIGFKEAKKNRCDYVVFHDVDMLPIDVDYSYSDKPIHLASDNIPFPTYFGGITLFPVSDFEKVNGFSNNYWGWGFEDDDLRYRCDKKKVIYGNRKSSYYRFREETLFFNGNNSYININNIINYVRDFQIEIDLQLGTMLFDPSKAVDIFPIFNIKGLDFTLSFNSFNRFHLQFFDKKNKYYDSTSEIIINKGNKILISYNKREKSILFEINKEVVEKIFLEHPLYNYKESQYINIGTNADLSSFYCGSIDRLSIKNGHSTNILINKNNLTEGELTTKNGGNLIDKISNVEFKKYITKEVLGNRIPFRRQSKLKKLSHEDSGFTKGVWKHDMTRWNQIKFNNDVANNPDYRNKEGLSTCWFKLNNKMEKGRVIHLNIGI